MSGKAKNTITIRKVYSEHGEQPISVEPGEIEGCVRVVASGDEARDYWGQIDFTLDANHARELAAAILACADDSSDLATGA